jgi:hypothetical protein
MSANASAGASEAMAAASDATPLSENGNAELFIIPPRILDSQR